MDKVNFNVNGIKCSVGSEISSDVTLLDYLRNHLQLRGTKYMCREGGCGACIVSVVKSPHEDPVAVNSCLVSVTSCYDWEITTVEKVGNIKDGYHPVQKTLADNNGTQCGHCTPGWVMAMYSLLKSKKNLTKLEIEKSFGSNVCRCTGYRPILEAFKKFAVDEKDSIKIPDIEDLKICEKTGVVCSKKCCSEDDWLFVSNDGDDSILKINLKDDKLWYRVSTVNEIFHVFNMNKDKPYMLVGGNTAKGAYHIDDYPTVLIDISGVSELKGWKLDQNLIINGGTTLTVMLEIFKEVSKEDEFAYLDVFYNHLEKVAHIPVRNIGTMAGNLMLKHKHNDFPSDIFLLLLTANATLTIGENHQGKNQSISMEEFLDLDMTRKVILNAELPPLSDSFKVITYKILPKSQNAHAIVNAGFVYKLDQSDEKVEECRIVYSGLKPPFTRATLTEKWLTGKELFSNDTVQGATKVLENEIEAKPDPPAPSPEYRKQLALGLFYKAILSICPTDKLHVRYHSGAKNLHDSRPVSKGQQIYDTDPSIYPLNQPLQKIEALRQCSAEVPYTDDIPSLPNEVFASFVLSTIAVGHISNIDASEALSLPGVIEFYTAKNISGSNNFIPNEIPTFEAVEEILCSGEIKYYNQPIGIIVAESRHLADRAAKLVKVTYKNVRKPVLDVREAKKDPERVKPFLKIPAINKGFDVHKVIKGEQTLFHQYAFCMETLVTVTKPSEDGFEVHGSFQFLYGAQIIISKALKMDANSIDVFVRRCGGGFGLKISRSLQGAAASAIVAQKLNRPCRVIQSLETNMRAIGKRLPCLRSFEVGVNKKGEIQYANYDIYEDNGYVHSETLSLFTVDSYNNAYALARWNFNGYDVLTDTAKNSWTRSPGTFSSIALAEFLMERIAYETSNDPVDVRLANLNELLHSDVKEMYETLKTKANYAERRSAVDKFNTENRWKKRGLRVAFMKWTVPPAAQYLDITLSVNQCDGSISIIHSGIEMGQGINTRAVQIAAHFLKIPVDKIKIKGNNSFSSPNGYFSGGSVTSQSVGIGIQRCCEELLTRLAPVKLLLPFASWEEQIKKAYALSIDLQCHGFVKITDGVIATVYGVCIAEVEVDILTGESEILRVDLLEDAGRSLNPELDIGQIEGAFVMGLGFWLTEQTVFDQESGEVLSDRTWNYYVPQARDIPQDFRVYFRKNSYSADKVLGTKPTSEPPICLSVVVPLAIREAIASARLEAGIPTTQWFDIDGPYTLEAIALATKTKTSDFKLT